MTDRPDPFPSLPLVDEPPPIVLRDAAGGTYVVPLQHVGLALEQIAKVKPLGPHLLTDWSRPAKRKAKAC